MIAHSLSFRRMLTFKKGRKAEPRAKRAGSLYIDRAAAKVRYAIDKWEKNPEKYARKQRQLGTYYLRSNIDIGKESEVWDFLPYYPGSRDHVPDPEDRPRSSTDISQERSIYHFPSSFGAAGLLAGQHSTM